MKKIITPLVILLLSSVMLISCSGGGKKDAKKVLTEKQAELNKLLQEQDKLTAKINKLQKEIALIDPDAAIKPKLVEITPIGVDNFDHYINLQGMIDSRNVAFASPNGQGGRVTSVLVSEGSYVNKGQAILQLDASIYKQQVITAQQQLGGIKAQLDQAKSIYQRQQNLWKNNIGTEVQVLNAKTNVDALQSQYNAAQENVQLMREQLSTTTVTAGISGTVNKLEVRVGEFFAPGSDKIQIVNNSDLKVRVNVPENYLDRVNAGDVMEVTLPGLDNRAFTSKVSIQGKIIDPITRSFYVEGSIPNDKEIRPNQIATVKIKDYSNSQAITVPLSVVQNDEDGKYVMVASDDKGKLTAMKKPVVIGELYGDKIEIKSGLQTGDQLITNGFQNLYQGQTLETDTVKK